MRPPRDSSSRARTGPAAPSSLHTGRFSRTCVPLPVSLLKSTVPPHRATAPYTVDRPSPVPTVILVVKNGSGARLRVSSSIPAPSSATSTHTPSPSVSLRTAIIPPSGSASTALKTRFTRASCRPDRVARTGGVTSSSVRTTMVVPRASASSCQRGRVSATASSTTSLTSTGRSASVSSPRTLRASRCTRSRARHPESKMVLASRLVASSVLLMSSISAGAIIPVSMLFRLWLTPAAISPSPRSRSRRTCSSRIRRRSVTSWITACTAVSRPSLSLTG